MRPCPRRLLVVAAFAIAAHALSLANGFVFDDASALVSNPTVTGSFSAARVAHNDFWGRARTAPNCIGTWRPLPTLTFFADWHLSGGRPWLFHAVNLAWHALAAVLLALALASVVEERLALLAAALWAILAVNCEAVASIVGRADVMAAAFSFAALWLWRRHVGAACAAYLAACCCKESAAALPAWLFALELLFVDQPARRRPSAFVALAATGAAYAAARTLLFGSFSAVLVGANNNPLFGASAPVRLWTAMRLFLMALRTTLFPLNLAGDYSGAEISPDTRFMLEPFAGALALAVAIAVIVRWRARARPVALGLFLFVATFAVVSNVPFVLPMMFAERFLYLPAAGLALALAWAGAALSRSLAGKIAVALFVAMQLLFTVKGDRMWHDDRALFSVAVTVSPNSWRAWLNYAVELHKLGARAEAAHAFERSLALSPSTEAMAGLGGLYDELGRPADAERLLGAAVRSAPDDRTSIKNATIFYARHRRYDLAAAIVRPYLARHPDDPELHQILVHLEASLNRGAP